MRITFGLKAHSGWAALVALGKKGGDLQLVERRRIELVPADARGWAKQPYHAAEGLPAPAARAMVRRGFDAARRQALQEMRAAVKRAGQAQHEIAACAVLMGEPMPAWSVDEILAVHFRMHKAEGVLFRDVLVRAVAGCGVEIVALPEKLLEQAARKFVPKHDVWLEKLTYLGRLAGPPWGKDQKDAALAALIALHGRPPRGASRPLPEAGSKPGTR